MKKIFTLLLLIIAFNQSKSQTFIQVFNNILYYDGYAARVDSPAPPAGIIRHRNDLYARKLTASELASIGTTLHMKVTVGSSCDNYDRIGNVNMALVSKDSSTYNPSAVPRIEIGRYITPFMNKNVNPKTVPYDYDIDNIALLLKDTGITNNFDIWIELELFGVPYAANTQVAGCAGRNDVFYGSLMFTTNTATPVQHNNLLIPLSMKNNLNNYQISATDTLGMTTRKLTFNVPENLTDASFFFITSNHGSNSGGEEYNRRYHYIYVDDSLKLTYKPGRTSCEPFRVYNSQANGIYGSAPRTNAQWQSFSNWCPGDVIDNRRIMLGAVTAGTHSFRINVPDAVFVDAQGYFPFSVYFQGKTSGTIDPTEPIDTTTNPTDTSSEIKIYPNPARDHINIVAKDATALRLINIVGQTIYINNNPTTQTQIFTEKLSPGTYILQIVVKGKLINKKIIISD